MRNNLSMGTAETSRRKNPLDDLGHTATDDVVKTAARILEMELAAGGGATQEASIQAVSNGTDATRQNLLAIVDRFEHDAKEVVTMLAEMFRIIAKSSEGVATTKPR